VLSFPAVVRLAGFYVNLFAEGEVGICDPPSLAVQRVVNPQKLRRGGEKQTQTQGVGINIPYTIHTYGYIDRANVLSNGDDISTVPVPTRSGTLMGPRATRTTYRQVPNNARHRSRPTDRIG
jgi:hypothetical protein